MDAQQTPEYAGERRRRHEAFRAQAKTAVG
jgi:hypothetical protein